MNAARPVRKTPVSNCPIFIGTSDEIRIGAVVWDRSREMPATVRNVDGTRVELTRPAGHPWWVHHARLRPASEREQRQLAALATLRR